MALLKELLFSSPLVGWLSLFTILFVVLMAFYFIGFFSKHIEEDVKRIAQQRERNAKT